MENKEVTSLASADSASTEPPDLTCVVCGDKANGMHYRALTCEGCKTFFRRNARNRHQLKCEMMSSAGCEMDMYTRRHCAACRMKKCISVGMQPDRLWDQDRLATRKPIKKKVKVKKDSKAKSPVKSEDATATATAAAIAPLLPALIAEHVSLGKLLAQAYRMAKEKLPAPSPDVSRRPAPQSHTAYPHLSPPHPAWHSTYSHTVVEPQRTSPEPGTKSDQGPAHRSSPSSVSPAKTSQNVGSVPPEDMVPPGGLVIGDIDAQTSNKGVLPAPATVQQSSLNASHGSTPTIPSTVKNSSPAREVQGPAGSMAAPAAEKFAAPPPPNPPATVRRCECGCIIHNKPEEKQPLPTPPQTDCPPSASGAHEASTANREKTESTYAANAKDAEDTDEAGERILLAGGEKGPTIVPHIMELVVLLLRHMINFAKQLPGFQNLSSDDQATLIRGALVEYMILTSCPLYDTETQKFNSEIWPSLSIETDQVESAGFIKVIGSVQVFAVKMNKLSLTEEELALLFAMAIMSPDRRDLEDTTTVEEIQQTFVDALQTHVQLNHSQKTGQFAKIIMLLTEVRDTTEAYMDDLMSIQLSGSKLNPLLEELFSS